MRRLYMLMAVVVAVSVAIGGLALVRAADTEIILGKLFQVNDPKPGVDPTKRRVKVKGLQKPPGDADHVDNCGDPLVDGATIRIIANGTTSTDVTYGIPPGPEWKRIPDNTAKPLIGFKYRNPNRTGGPSAVKTFLVKRATNGTFVLQALIKGANGAVDNVPPDPGTSGGAIVTIGGGGCTFCVSLGDAAGGKVVNSPGTPPQNKLFKVVSTGSEPTVEVPCPGGVVTTTSTTTSTSTSTTATTLPGCCTAERVTLTSSAGTLQVDNLPAFPFPSGVTTVMDTSAATVGLPTCQHDVVVPAGGFFVPNFDIPALNYCSSVTATGCESGGTDGKGRLWDGAGTTDAITTIVKNADTSDGVCDATFTPGTCVGGANNGNPCAVAGDCPGGTCTGSNCTTAGVGNNTNGLIVTTRSATPGANTGVRSAIDVPVHSLTWSDSACSPAITPGCCPGSTYNPGDGDLPITEFDFILSPTTGSATGAFTDLNADLCKRAGAGFDTAAPGPDGPKTLTGSPASGPCCQVGQATTVVSVGAAFSGGAPLYDLGFQSTIPNTVSACGTPTGGSCTISTNPCLGSPSGAFLDTGALE